MKLQALEKAAAMANEQARGLEIKSQHARQAAGLAKTKAVQAKRKLKLSKREAKQARQAAKTAKRVFARAQRACEEAAIKAASLDKKTQKARRKARQAVAGDHKPKIVHARRRPAAKPQSRVTKPMAAKAAAIPSAPAKSRSNPKPVLPQSGNRHVAPLIAQVKGQASPTSTSQP